MSVILLKLGTQIKDLYRWDSVERCTLPTYLPTITQSHQHCVTKFTPPTEFYVNNDLEDVPIPELGGYQTFRVERPCRNTERITKV